MANCLCGCGKEVFCGRQWYRGHKPSTAETHDCLCGCGSQVARNAKWVSGHHWRGVNGYKNVDFKEYPRRMTGKDAAMRTNAIKLTSLSPAAQARTLFLPKSTIAAKPDDWDEPYERYQDVCAENLLPAFIDPTETDQVVYAHHPCSGTSSPRALGMDFIRAIEQTKPDKDDFKWAKKRLRELRTNNQEGN